MSSPTGRKRVVVLGAGVVGLTTAVKIQEKGEYNVTIIAETFPTDPKTIMYTSLWAGAHHVSHAANDAKQMAIDRETFNVMWKLSEPGGAAEHCFLRVAQTDYLLDGRDECLDWMPDFKTLPQDALVPGTSAGTSFTTVNIDTPVYLPYLLARFLSRGGSIVRGSVQHISQVIEGGPGLFRRGRADPEPVHALVICPGLGARTLGGVEDKNVYPVRGQVVIIRAPWIKSGRTVSHLEQGLWTYIIPRRSGDVILGGTKQDNDWYPAARPETTTDILERCLALCPEIVPPAIRAERQGTIEDVRALIVEEGCGFRPQRKGGIRLDVDWVPGRVGQGSVPMVFNYGHGGGGYQSSWGSASIALELLEKALASPASKS
ncbi:D-amino-acid oxidase [Dichomitus squalens LYAD-421 SS1]|uniref:D-amino-acid oxidase n=1 Tax=Dichomitus squalens (strain LYAD-421) TaxID=732165 RepID=UPI0004410E4A|nr:D-amino-acid oxidase [Dichomitus squalens LYAD-421 SS1]EJF63901.1 D-amino-acid oxidase [Dichomitus squalens LYAD-421 SS1]